MVLLEQKPSQIWNKSFANNMPHLWNSKIDTQYVLNAYVAMSYCSSNMTKVDKSVTFSFKGYYKNMKREKSMLFK